MKERPINSVLPLTPIYHFGSVADQLARPGSSARRVESHTTSFEIAEGLHVNFEAVPGAAVDVSCRRAHDDRAHYTITPRNMGPSRWFSLEIEIAPAQLRNISQVIPILVAGSTRSVSLFAVMRLTLPDNRITDTSSTRIELRKGRRSYSLPISIGDLPAGAVSSASAARMIFFVEARDVALDLYEISAVALRSADDDPLADERIAALRRRVAAHDPGVRHELFPFRQFAPKQSLRAHVALPTERARFDIDSANGASASVLDNDPTLVLDLNDARTARWCSFELRFGQVEPTSDLRAMLHLAAAAENGTSEMSEPIRCILRIYDDAWASFTDHSIADFPHAISDESEGLFEFDIASPLLAAASARNIGILCFVPPGSRRFELRAFEMFIFGPDP